MDGQHWLFFFVGLGFFLLCIGLTHRMTAEQHEQRMEKMREFGIPREGRRFRRRNTAN
jgi:hypothetical protein